MLPTVVVVTHRAGDLLQTHLDALGAQTLRPARVIVVVSSAAPIPRPRLPEGLPVELLYLGANPGFAAAANAGLRRAKGPVVLLNDDTAPQPEFLAALVAAAEPGAILQPVILLWDGSGRLDNLGHHLLPDGFNLGIGRGRPPPEPLPDLVGAFSGAGVYLPAELLAEVGLFDEDLEAFGEDVDLSLRAVRRGYTVKLVPLARMHHALGATYGRVQPRKIYLVERNRVRAALRSLPATAILGMPATTALRLGLMGWTALRGGGPGAGAGLGGALAARAGGLAGAARAPDALRKRARDRAGWARGESEMLEYLWRHRATWEDLGGRA